MENSSSALLIARPSGFGKSLTLSMFKAFLSLNYADPGNISCQQRLFKNTQILKKSKFCEKFMGKFPVIFLSLKSIISLIFSLALSLFSWISLADGIMLALLFEFWTNGDSR